VEDDWIEHRRFDDGERVGWMKPVGEGFVAIDLLGRQRTSAVDWMLAEETLDALSLSYLANAEDDPALAALGGATIAAVLAELDERGV